MIEHDIEMVRPKVALRFEFPLQRANLREFPVCDPRACVNRSYRSRGIDGAGMDGRKQAENDVGHLGAASERMLNRVGLQESINDEAEFQLNAVVVALG